MPARESFDTIVLGAGPAGEVIVFRLAKQGLRVALVERELIGGECSYWACVPSKTLLRPPEVQDQSRRGFGITAAALDWRSAAGYRDEMVRHYDDSRQLAEYAEMGVTVVKAAGRLEGPQTVIAGDRRLEAGHIVLATGSRPSVPPIPGLVESGYWTNREVTGMVSVPESAAVVGAGAVAVEAAQLLARYGAQVTMLVRGDRLLAREVEKASELLAGALAEAGVKLHFGVNVAAVRRDDGGRVLELDNGSSLSAAELVIATGRRPRLAALGLETVGLEGADRLTIDDLGRAQRQGAALDGLWAAGDVTGVALFTHVAKYQGRTVAANILAALGLGGEQRRLDYRAVPRVVFTEPEVAGVGLTPARAAEQGIAVRTAQVELSELTRPFTYEREPRGMLQLVVGERDGEVLGATAVGPMAGEWIHIAALAVRLRLTASTLRDAIFQFPTFSEAYVAAAEELDR